MGDDAKIERTTMLGRENSSQKGINLTSLQNAMISSWNPRNSLKVEKEDCTNILSPTRSQNKEYHMNTLVKLPEQSRKEGILVEESNRGTESKEQNPVQGHEDSEPLNIDYALDMNLVDIPLNNKQQEDRSEKQKLNLGREIGRD
ncbi:hypothetical protein SLEP1_g34415 [Rubroshorea leprosula]|uniref:Uncharacterized protein n=2 Tax=Rubroshorea leprosula TaxID=152421 RepID=A0AAV5KK62_9ROSI|nr:hypothetical protein SLEP1_g34415 [Rubroshorea leprosula]